jgi:membrane protease YdiL (CAAX protease family)
MARAAFWGKARAVAVAVLWIALFAVVGVIATVALVGIAGFAAGAVAAEDPTRGDWDLAVSSTLGVVGFAVATWLVGRRLNRRSWGAMGWGEPRRLAARLAMGVALGAVMAGAAVGLAVLVGGAAVRLDPDAGTVVQVAPLAVGLLAAALAEELMFRGYPLRRLAEAVGPVGATAVLGVGFGVAHLGNPNVTALGTVNIGIAAVWLAAAFFSPGGMPLAWGLHFGWNAGLGLGFEAPVSGLTFDLPLVDYAPGGHGWIDGGAFGPEGGLVTTLVFSTGVLALLAARSRRRAVDAA